MFELVDIVPFSIIMAAADRPDSIFGTTWMGFVLTGLFWFLAIIVFFALVRFIWPPKAKTVIEPQGDEKTEDK